MEEITKKSFQELYTSPIVKLSNLEKEMISIILDIRKERLLTYYPYYFNKQNIAGVSVGQFKKNLEKDFNGFVERQEKKLAAYIMKYKFFNEIKTLNKQQCLKKPKGIPLRK